MIFNKIQLRVSALLLLIVMALGSVCFPVFAEDVTTDLSVEKGLLCAVGILPDKELSASKISRADFAVYTARLIGINDFDQNEQRYFYDVPMNHYALNSINKLVDLKVLSMDADKEFRPDDIITFNEACKVLVSALGYDDMAKAYGGYPAGYLSVANRLGISKGLGGDELSTETAVYMLYNALKADVQDIISLGSDGVQKKANGETALSVYHDISFAKGTLTAIDGMSMYSDINTEIGQAYIDDTRYDCSVNLNDLFGSYVEYYYKENGSAQRELIYAEDLSDKTVTIESDDFSRYIDGTIYYYKNNKASSVSTVTAKTIVYNGRPIKSDIESAFSDINYGTITVKQSKNNGNDLIIIDDYIDMYVSAVSENIESVSDSKLTNSVINIKDWENLVFKTEDGTSIEYNEITPDSILSVKKSKDKVLLYGRITASVVSGKIESIYENDGTKVMIDSVEYKLTKTCAQKFKDSIKVGATYKYYLNIDGKIAYINTDGANNMVSGYLTNAVKNDNSFDNNLKIRLLNEDGKRVIYETVDKLKIDGVEYTDPDKMIAAFPSDSGDKTKVEPQLIMYKLSGEKIKEIDTYGGDAANEDKTNTLMRYIPEWNEVLYYSSRFGWKIPVRSGGKLYTVPENDKINSAADKKFTVQTTNGTVYSTISGKRNNVFYKLGTDAIYYDYAASIGDAVYNLNEAVIAVVTEIYDTMDEDGMLIKGVTLLGGQTGTPTTSQYQIDDTVSTDNLEKGDVIRCSYAGNVIRDYELLYDESSDALPTWAGVTDYWNLYQAYTYYGDVFQLSFGYVNSKKDNMLRWGYKSAQVIDETWNQYISSTTGGSRIIIWDTENEKGYIGSIDDVIDYETYGRGSRVILQTCWSEFRAIVVYI